MIYSAINALKKKKSELCTNSDGVAMIEFAFLLPVFIMLGLGIIEFGMWFYESEITTSSVNNITNAVQNNPNITTAELQQMVNVANNGLVRLSFYDPASNPGSKNYICVKAYTSKAAAQAGGCTKTDLNAANPGPPGSTYAVAIDAFVAPNAITPLGSIVKALTPTTMGMTMNTASVVGNIYPQTACANTANAWGVLQYNPSATPEYSCFYIPFPNIPNCDGIGQVLQYDGTSYSCPTITPPINCNQPWQNLEWNSSTRKWSCQNVAYVFAGGTAHAATPNWATGAPITTDETWVSWMGGNYPSSALQLYRTTLCTPIQFTVPAGLPAGQIIAQGNLIYPGANNDGDWHAWSVSFEKLDTGPAPPTTKAYNATAYLCMDNGGNWVVNSSGPTVGAEEQSWTVTFIPDSP